MMRTLLLQAVALLVGISNLAIAEEPAPPLIGRVTGGVYAYLDEAGQLHLQANGPVQLDNGRQVVEHEGRWQVTDPTSADQPKPLSGLDFSAYGAEYVGQSVRVTGGYIFNADADSAILHIVGSMVHLRFGSLDRTKVRQLIRDCSGFMTETDCTFDVSGTVSRGFSSLELRDITIGNPTKHAVQSSTPRRR